MWRSWKERKEQKEARTDGRGGGEEEGDHQGKTRRRQEVNE